MGIFNRKKKDSIPIIQSDKYELVLRCSICTGEQVLCMQDRTDGSLKELMLIRSYKDLQEVCDANHIDAATVRKIY